MVSHFLVYKVEKNSGFARIDIGSVIFFDLRGRNNYIWGRIPNCLCWYKELNQKALIVNQGCGLVPRDPGICIAPLKTIIK